MSVEKIIGAWQKKSYKPLYWLEGEEEYYIDIVMNYAEHELLTTAEAEFNLTIFYGKDADWIKVINACKRYPMYADKQVVLLKEAQHMKEIDKLEAYFAAPLSTTILVVGYKAKGLDKRTKLYNTVKATAEVLTTKKIAEGHLQEWIITLVKNKGYTIKPKSAALLEEHTGNDLSRIENEIDKLLVNLQHKKTIDDDDIEKYIGVSKEYNLFELQAAIAYKNMAKAFTILNYFESNPKAAAIQAVLPAMYSFFSKVYAVYGMVDKSDAALKPFFYYNPSSLAQAKETMKCYGYNGIEAIILLLHHYDLKSKGVQDTGTDGAILMKEMVAKIMIM